MLYEAIGDIEIRVTAVDNSRSIDYGVMAIKDGLVLERIDGSIDKTLPGSGNLSVDINKLKNKFYLAD